MTWLKSSPSFPWMMRANMRHTSAVAIVLAAAVAATSVAAQETGDVKQGLSLARQVCAECHAVQAHDLRSPNPRAPTFVDIARTPGMTYTALTIALTTPHAGMPMFKFTADQRADIIAHILALKQAGTMPGR